VGAVNQPRVYLRPITDLNRAEVEALRASPAQEQFVSGVADSLEEAIHEPGGRAICYGFERTGDVVLGDELLLRLRLR
jgi:hypothetical protein